MTSLVIWTSKLWSFGRQKFGHLEVKRLVIWMSKVTSFQLQKLDREDVRSFVLDSSSRPNIRRSRTSHW